MQNITFQQIDAFLTIARYQKLSWAAESMFITEPALSRMLSRFEENVGSRLFERNNKGVRLTEEGEYLYSVLEPLYKITEKSLTSVRDIAAPKRTLKFAAPMPFDIDDNYNATKELIREYKERYPDVNVEETLLTYAELRQQLEFGTVDAAIAQDYAVADMRNISYSVISPFKLSIAISDKHPAAAEPFDAALLRGEQMFIVRKAVTDDALMLYNEMGFNPENIRFVPNLFTMLHKLFSGEGFSICGSFIANSISGGLKFYPVEQTNPSQLVVAWRNDRFLSDEMQNLVNLIPETVSV
ncbi:MAG: LysR family transcriptional regulator [Oscillospiraceae bacterium]|nr:LysR family transcriptional regulator [Oscillospiraceae bacterium]